MKGTQRILSLAALFAILIAGCKKEDPKTIPVLETAFPTSVTSNSANAGGNITSDGGAEITSRGVCWSLEQFPTIDDNKTSNGTGKGSFSSSLTGLSAGSTYYVRAYAVNAVGVAYGNQVTFTTTTLLPTITTTAISNITSISAVSGGDVTDDGGATITVRGVCWSTGQNPTTVNSCTTNGTGKGSFTSNLINLTPGATYYVRAYATNSVGTVYGNQLSFTTPAAAPTVTTATITNINSSSATGGGEITDNGGGTITARGVCWSIAHNPTTSDPKTSDVQLQILGSNPFEPEKANAPGGSFISTLSGLNPGTTYYVRAYATNSTGTSYGSEVSFTTLATLPVVSTTAPSSVTATGVQTGGQITSDGGAAITSRGVCWGTSQNPSIAGDKTADGTGTGVFTSNINGLVPGTTYYIRAYATNNTGTGYGQQLTFSTLAVVPTVTTSAITQLTSTTAMAGGLVTSDGGASVSERGVCWSLSQNPTTADNKLAIGTGTGSYSQQITGLLPGHTYYVRAYAINTAGTAYGSQVICTTLPEMPAVTTVDISSIERNSAVSGGTITSDGGGAITAKGVCWSTAQNPTIDNNKSSDGTGSASYTSDITGLNPGTTYYVRAYVSNNVGTSYGQQLTFTTLAGPPVVSTDAVSELTATTATAGGVVSADGGATVTERGVCWSTSQNPTTDNSKLAIGSGVGNFSDEITGLISGHTYYLRAYAINNTGTSYGNQVVFTTLADIPTVITSIISSVGKTTAVSGGTITSDGGATVSARGVCWSTGQNPTISNNKTSDGSGTGTYVSNLTGLNPGTTYYVRAYATNSAGTAYGPQGTVTTLVDVPVVTTETVSDVTATTATGGGVVVSEGGRSVTARGICWSTGTNPTVSNNKSTDGSGPGSFVSAMTGLTRGTLYYVRAYATNSEGTSYGEQESFMTEALTPTVTTASVTGVTTTAASCGGEVTDNGGSSVTLRGVCWSTSQNPTIEDTKTEDGSGTGSFTSSITGLTPGTTYYVRAYATNSKGTSYGTEMTFTATVAP